MVYTIGTSNRLPLEFVELLKHYKIQVLVDIRRFPTSKFEHFKKENVSRFLKENGIDYLYLGKELGGYRTEGYENYMKTESFRQGLEKLKDLAKDKTMAIFCSERFAFRCHRRFVGFALMASGYKIIHIIDKDKVWIPKDK
ncbi:MAG: DUF488 domain-containing protein [Candidatus Omnitrophica bacterium]|nr:DUF488 domain-containing protein [Candidatus Omnitrophota bacterium]